MKMLNKFIDYLNLDDELDDYDVIHDTIVKGVAFKGTNLWVLMFAIIIASVGLNTNSTAVIIGAMLISPLMGPINGMGYSIATYNFPLFRKSIKNFTFAVITGLITSTIYFAVSPLSVAYSELLARTSPTIYDVLIALFGGLAGIVAISSKQRGNVIPGVAIATALMPPLCTAGYGLATLQFNYFFGAFYLFTINTVFIALSSVAISQLLKFPIRTVIEPAHKAKVNRWIGVVTILILIPSIYFGFKLVQKERFTENAKHFVDAVTVVKGNYLLKNKIEPGTKTITLMYGGTLLNDSLQMQIRHKAKNYALKNAKIKFQQGIPDELLNRDKSDMDYLKSEVARMGQIMALQLKQTDSLQVVKMDTKNIFTELKAMFPVVVSCSYSKAYQYADNKNNERLVNVVIINTKPKRLPITDKQKIENWLKIRLQQKDIKVLYEE